MGLSTRLSSWTIQHDGTVNLLDESRELGELDDAQGRFGLCGLLDAADIVPRLEGAGALGAIVGSRHAVAGQEEEVVDLIVGGQETLSVPGRLEPLHLPLVLSAFGASCAADMHLTTRSCLRRRRSGPAARPRARRG